MALNSPNKECTIDSETIKVEDNTEHHEFVNIKHELLDVEQSNLPQSMYLRIGTIDNNYESHSKQINSVKGDIADEMLQNCTDYTYKHSDLDFKYQSKMALNSPNKECTIDSQTIKVEDNTESQFVNIKHELLDVEKSGLPQSMYLRIEAIDNNYESHLKQINSVKGDIADEMFQNCADYTYKHSDVFHSTSKKMKMSSDGKRKRNGCDEESVDENLSDDITKREIEKEKKAQNKIKSKRYKDKNKTYAVIESDSFGNPALSIQEEEKVKLRKEQNRQRSKRYRDKKKATTKNISDYDDEIQDDIVLLTKNIVEPQIYGHQTVTDEEEKIRRRREQNRQRSKRYREKKKATNLNLSQTNQSSDLTAIKHIPKCQYSNDSKAYLSTQNEPYFPNSHSDYDDQVRDDIILLADAVVEPQICEHQTIMVEEEEKIRRRKELNRQKSQRYRNKKRFTNLILSLTDQPSQTVVKHVSKCKNFHESQIAGPSTQNEAYLPLTHTDDLSIQNEPYISQSHSDNDLKIQDYIPLQTNDFLQPNEPITNFAANIQNFIPNDAKNNTQNMHPCYNLPYSSFQQNSCAHREFQKDFLENEFGHVCDICDRLWFKKDLKIVVNNDTTRNIHFIRTLLTDVNLSEVKICSTCLVLIRKNRIPPLSAYNGFKYPSLPEELKNFPLDLVTERLISPRIPFMQIRRLRHIHGQFRIYGQVINVPIEINTMVRSLPRNIEDDHSITVHIKRRKIHKSSYLIDMVNKRNIKEWLLYLKDTPLYTSYKITVDDTFLNGPDDVQNEITYDEDGDSDISEQISVEESLIAQQQTLMWNDEMYLRLTPGEANAPISLLFKDYAEELSFPQIYLGQFRTFRNDLMVTPFMMVTSEIRRSDRRGVTPHHLLYMAMNIIRIRVRDSRSIAFKHVEKSTFFTKEQIESEKYIHGCIESSLSFLRTIPNSAYYWSEMKKDLFAMIRQFGKPTIFFTISANEIGWPKLLQLLYNLKSNSKISTEDAAALHFIEKSTLVNEDAVTCAIYFNKLVNVLMKILQSKRYSPFQNYRILYFFKRIEFQHTGSPRAHILAWLNNAPVDALGKDYNKAINLIDFLISVSTAEASGNITLQKHKHSFLCYKGIASKNMQTCKFEAPFIPIKTTTILTPMKDTEDGFKDHKTKYNSLRKNIENYEYNDFETFYEDNNINSDQEYVNIIRAGINIPKVFPKRQPYEIWHNSFNPFILNIMKSNIDIQYITDEYSCAAYVAEYIDKTNRGVSNLQRKIIEIMDEHPEFDIFEIAKNISINLLNHTEITSQEAAWYLLREPISKSSTTIVYIPTVWPTERQKMKKTMKELSELDDDCTDIWKESWFDKYEKRPEELEYISLAQFVSKYYKSNREEYVQRDEPRVIRYRNYDMATDFNEYKREMVTLHIPFRHEEAEILEENRFITFYDKNIDLILQRRKEFESDIDIEKILEICQALCCQNVSDDNEELRNVAGRPPDQDPLDGSGRLQELYNDPTR